MHMYLPGLPNIMTLVLFMLLFSRVHARWALSVVCFSFVC